MDGWVDELEAAHFFNVPNNVDNFCVRNRNNIVRFNPDILGRIFQRDQIVQRQRSGLE